LVPNLAIPPTVAQANAAAVQDPFADLANIRIDQNFANTPGLEDRPSLVPVRRPGKQEYFRVNADSAYRLTAAILIDEENSDKDTFLLMGGIHTQLPGEYKLVNLRVTVSLQGTTAMWPVTIPGYNGERPDRWHLTAENAALQAETQWVRMRADKGAGGYLVAPVIENDGNF
jgi:hypothetical protein